MVLEKDGEDQLGRSCEKCRSVTEGEGEEECPAYVIERGRELDWSHLAEELPSKTR